MMRVSSYAPMTALEAPAPPLLTDSDKTSCYEVGETGAAALPLL